MIVHKATQRRMIMTNTKFKIFFHKSKKVQCDYCDYNNRLYKRDDGVILCINCKDAFEAGIADEHNRIDNILRDKLPEVLVKEIIDYIEEGFK